MTVVTKPVIVDLTRDDVKRGLEDGSILLIDVREADEFTAGHIPGAKFFPLSAFDAAKLPDPQGKRLVFSCRSGNRSVTAIQKARAAGLSFNEHYKGGFQDWVQSREPVALGLDG